MKCLGFVIFTVILAGCVGRPPFKEMNLTQTAMEAAKEAKSAEFAPGLWLKAEEEYRKAQLLYRDREYDKARVALKRARRFAEKAENSTRLKKFQSGGGL